MDLTVSKWKSTSSGIFRLIEIFNIEGNKGTLFFLDIEKLNVSIFNKFLEDIGFCVSQQSMESRFGDVQRSNTFLVLLS